MLLALLLAASATHPPLLVFKGNVALVEDVYRAVLDLPDDTRATPQSARKVAVTLRRFLHKAGYSLATVDAYVSGAQIVVQVDEGRLDKLIFLGGGAFETLRLRLDLDLHDDIFNRPELERQLKRLSLRLGLSDFAYEIVPVDSAPLPRLQLDEIEPLEELSMGLLRPGRPYELHILVNPGVFHPGLEPELQVDSLQGGGLGVTYHGGGLIAQDDRWDVGGRAAGALRTRLDNTSTAPAFTRAVAQVSYATSPIAGVLRPSLHVGFDLLDEQRADLHYESFQFAVIEAGATALFLPTKGIRAALGTGLSRRFLYDIVPEVNTPLPLEPAHLAQTRPYGELSLQLTFDPQNLRRDQHHELYLAARLYGAPRAGDEDELFLTANYQKIFHLGWNELWINARAISRSGYVIFPEEESLGDDLRGTFSTEFARKLLGLGVEFRYSLIRDLFKVGVFHNGLVYGAIDRGTDADKAALADSFGLAAHALFLDEFQLDAYFGVGFASGGKVDHGAALAIRQAF
jgi:hypothetical protein